MRSQNTQMNRSLVDITLTRLLDNASLLLHDSAGCVSIGEGEAVLARGHDSVKQNVQTYSLCKIFLHHLPR